MNPDYSRKTVLDWMEDMHSGALALADFQRSQVWSYELVSRYLKAVLTGQPTGTLLMVEPGEHLKGRRIDGNDADISEVKTLILDGQQRLTSLWHGLMDAGDRSYYIKVNDISAMNLDIAGVVAHSKEYRRYATVDAQFSDNVLPVKILYDPPNHPPTAARRLERWCEEAIPDGTNKAGNLRRAIEQSLQQPLGKYVIWYAKFLGIDIDEAVKIFVETNRSLYKINAFDLAVAQAVEIRRDIKVRSRIESFHAKNDRVKYYFSTDQGQWISEIGEYILKIACLKIGKPPKNSNFEEAVGYLFDSDTENSDVVEANLDAALHFLEDHGVPTEDFLPRIPPLYVIAALQSDLESIHETRRGQAMGLITKYLWWSFLSNRYKTQANDKLYEDYVDIRKDLQHLQPNSAVLSNHFTFDRARLPRRTWLTDPRCAFTSKSPLGRAITALTLDRGAKDWVTGEELTPSTVRQLEVEKHLDRHHVFPRQALTRGEGVLKSDDPLINHGMNIVLLRKKANITLSGKEPAVYLQRLLETIPGLTEEELGSRISSQISPYDILRKEDGSVRARYREYMNCRAELLWQLISERTGLTSG